MKKVLPIVIVLAVLVAGLVYYNSTKDNETDSSNNSSSQTSAPSNENNQATNTVAIEDMAFTPAKITVKKGATVTWTNHDSVAHTVTETDGQDGLKSGTLQKEESYSFTFNTVGTFKYDCTIHPSMTGTVTVTE